MWGGESVNSRKCKQNGYIHIYISHLSYVYIWNIVKECGNKNTCMFLNGLDGYILTLCQLLFQRKKEKAAGCRKQENFNFIAIYKKWMWEEQMNIIKSRFWLYESLS